MAPITYKNMQLFCRTCLVQLAKQPTSLCEKYNIHEVQELSKWLQDCTTIAAVPSEKYPKFVCHQCYDKLRSFYEFRCMSLHSMRVLFDLVNANRLESSAGQSEKPFENSINIDWLELPENIKSLKEQGKCLKTENYDDKNILNSFLQVEQIFTSPIEIPTLKMETEPDMEPDIKLDMESPLREEQIKVDEMNETRIIDTIQLPPFQEQPESNTQIYTDLENINNEDHVDSETETDADSTNHSHTPTAILKKSNKKAKPKTKPKVKKASFTKMIQCERCPRRCSNRDTFEAHMRTHEGLKPYECTECQRTFSKAFHYRLHMREVHPAEKQEFVCTYEGCGKIFERETTYKAHYRTKHVLVNHVRQRCVCEQCGRTFRNVTKLKEHSYRHADLESYPFKCDQCDKCFNKKRSYKEHLLRHAGIKNFVCSYCGMKKTTREELRVHLNCHTKQKQWQCEICQAVFTKAANMARHVRVVHEGIKKYACRYCDQRFGKPDTWKHHEMRHTGEKPHGCDLCGKRFIQLVALRTHLKTHAKYGHAITSQPSLTQPQPPPTTLAQI